MGVGVASGLSMAVDLRVDSLNQVRWWLNECGLHCSIKGLSDSV